MNFISTTEAAQGTEKAAVRQALAALDRLMSRLTMDLMSEEKPKLSVQTIVYIIMVVLCFLFFIWSGMSANRNPNYEDIPAATPTK